MGLSTRTRRARVRTATGVVATLALTAAWSGSAAADTTPYGLPGQFAAAGTSPSLDARAPFTPTVLSLLHQLEPAQPDPQHDTSPAVGTTLAQLQNAALILHGTEGTTTSTPCTGVGEVAVPTGTTPAIAPLCWTDALGVGVSSGAQVRRTTASPIRLSMASSFDSSLTNAWGQVEGSEARQLGITGVYAPQVDITRYPDWGRNDPTYGEDPLLSGTMAASEINGLQSKGAMAQVKHFAFYNGVLAQVSDVQAQDQAAHQIFLPPYEYGTTGSGSLPKPGQAASMMCSYQRYQIVATPGVTGTPAAALGPNGGDLACDNQVMNYVARGQWGYQGFIASDYRLGMDSAVKSITNGNDQEMPDAIYFGNQMAAAVMTGLVPLSTFNQSIARVLYQEERFRLLGHADADSDYLSNSNPSDSAGAYPLSTAQKNSDAATVELAAEEGAVLLKNTSATLPLTSADLKKGVLVIGTPAEYMPANPGVERSNGYYDRDAISPLEQLKQYAAAGSKITYLPGFADGTIGDGQVVPKSVLSTDGVTAGTGLSRTTGPGSPRTDPQVDFTSVSGHGQLQPNGAYTWTGYVNVPAQDDYTFHFQFSVPDVTPASDSVLVNTGAPSACNATGAPTFSLATVPGQGQTTAGQTLVYSGATANGIATGITKSGNTERGLANCEVTARALTAGLHQVQIGWTAPGSLGTDASNIREPGSTLPSFRFGYSRAAGDLTAAVAAAKTASKVVIFAETGGSVNPAGNAGATGTDTVNSFDATTNSDITTLAAANPNTAVVLNVATPTLTPWASNVKSILQMWLPGEEGGTATARLLLGLANPSGHLPLTWPAASTDTVSQYSETAPLYSGDTTGTHPERFAGATVAYSEGIYVGYRFFDRERLIPQFPFGWGLSYTSFGLSGVSTAHANGGLDVTFTATNTGKVAGSFVPQIYVGPAPTVPTGVQQADKSLAGYDRITLNPGQSVKHTIHIGAGADVNGHGDRRAFQYWNSPTQSWTTTAGCRTIWVATSDSINSLSVTTRGDSNPTSSCTGKSTTTSTAVPVPGLPLAPLGWGLVALLAAGTWLATSSRRQPGSPMSRRPRTI